MVNAFSKFSKNKLLFNEPLRNHTSFQIGGTADMVFFPENLDDIIECVNICKAQGTPHYIIGKGTNILASDKGYNGVIIKMERLNKITKLPNGFHAEAGVNVADLSNYFLEQSCTGFEFACGIPGSLGGAIFMNAGAYDREMKHVIKSVDLISNGNLITLSNEEMEFGYRKSAVKGTDMIVVGANISVEKGEYYEIKQKVDHLTSKRERKQPLEMPSAGSTFKRPKGDFAGRLIQDSGMVGFRVGGAMVSEKHAGFIVNTGNATSQDVVELISKIKGAVKEQFNIELEEELIKIG